MEGKFFLAGKIHELKQSLKKSEMASQDKETRFEKYEAIVKDQGGEH